jgi:triosephosphate isomerase
MLCVGEDEEERERQETEEVLARQVTSALKGLPSTQVAGMVVAYEPVWAIGTGQTASADDAQSGCSYIRSVAGEVAGKQSADSLRVLYGGSVTADTASDLASGRDVDGFLVGGASLRAAEFVAIIRAASPKPSKRKEKAAE